MLTKFLHFVGRALNVAQSEVPHVLISWWLGLISRISMVIGWTLLTVFFVSNFGIGSLPYLFILHAVGIIFGSLIFSNLVSRLKKEYLLLSIILFTCLILAFGGYFYQISSYLFIGAIVLCLSVLLAQFKIVASLFVEEMFTPTQSSRVFPIIESSETFGLIFGGLLVSILAPVLPLHKFLYIWLIAFISGIPALAFYLQQSINIPFDALINKHVKKKKPTVTSLFRGHKIGSKFKFLKVLVIIVLFQWAFFNILEFQYTKAIEQSITGEKEETLVLHELNEFGKASVLIANDKGVEYKNVEHENLEDDVVVAQSSPGEEMIVSEPVYDREFEKSFASDLGLLQILFGGATLIFQLFLASRLLSYLGVVGSMLVYPIVLFVSVLWMTISYGFGSALIARFNHEVANVLHYNAYHSSYYALAHDMRASVKEFLEGFIRPVGAIFGTLVLIVSSFFFVGESYTLFIDVVSVFLVLGVLIATLALRSRYDELPRIDLENSSSLNVLINALNVIEQNSVNGDADFVVEVFEKRNDLPLDVEKRLILTLGKIGSSSHISYLIDLIHERDDLLREILHTINDLFARYHDDVVEKPFTWYALTKLYQDLLRDVEDPNLKAELISFIIISNYHRGLVDEIVYLLENEIDEETISVCTDTLKMIDDAHVVSFLKHLIDHPNPKVRASIAYVLSSYTNHRVGIDRVIKEMLESGDETEVAEALILIFKLNVPSNYEAYLMNLQSSTNNKDLQFLIYANRFLTGDKAEFTNFLHSEIIFDDLNGISILVNRLQNPLISKYFRRRVASEIHDVFMVYNKLHSDEITKVQIDLLLELRFLYSLIGADKEFFVVEEILR